MKLYKDLGFYLPSFFTIQVTDEKNTFRTLVHELIHFLQDVSTTYGLINISRTVDEIKELNRLYLNGKTIDDISEEYKANRQIQNSILGYGANLYCQFTEDTKVVSLICTQLNQIENPTSGETIDLFEVTVYLEDITTSYKDSYHIGAMAIMESMAHIIENSFYGKKDIIKTFPYDIVSMIVDYMLPNFTKEPLAVSELCEASLMYYDPAKILYEILYIMKRTNFEHTKPGDTYKYVLTNYHVVDNDKLIDVLNHYSGFPLETAMSQVDDLLTVSPYMDEHLASTWISNAKVLRSDKSTSITSLCYLGQGQLHNKIKFIGLPLVIDNGDVRSSNFNSDKQSIFLYPVMSTFLNTILNKENKTSCKLCTYCINHPDIMSYDELCDITPWNKNTDTRMCPFLDIKRMWGFESKNISD